MGSGRAGLQRLGARLLGCVAAALVGLLVLAACGAPTDAPDPVAADGQPSHQTSQEHDPGEAGTPSDGDTREPSDTTPTPTWPAPSPAAPASTSDPGEPELARGDGVPADAQPAVVERIVDGDTIWVRVDEPGSGPLEAGASHNIRLLEYDSPESTTSTECFGPEATERLASLIPVGTDVWLEADTEDTDRYGRHLRYVWLADGTMVNLVMVREGFGEAVLYQPNDRHIDLLRAAEEEARAADAGMWAACGGDGAPPDGGSDPGDGGDGENPWGTDSCHPAYDPCVPPVSEVGDLNCPDIREEHPSGVRVDHTHGDPHGLDGDRDGHGCE